MRALSHSERMMFWDKTLPQTKPNTMLLAGCILDYGYTARQEKRRGKKRKDSI
jgi:hypothetical protein